MGMEMGMAMAMAMAMAIGDWRWGEVWETTTRTLVGVSSLLAGCEQGLREGN